MKDPKYSLKKDKPQTAPEVEEKDPPKKEPEKKEPEKKEPEEKEASGFWEKVKDGAKKLYESYQKGQAAKDATNEALIEEQQKINEAVKDGVEYTQNAQDKTRLDQEVQYANGKPYPRDFDKDGNLVETPKSAAVEASNYNNRGTELPYADATEQYNVMGSQEKENGSSHEIEEERKKNAVKDTGLSANDATDFDDKVEEAAKNIKISKTDQEQAEEWLKNHPNKWIDEAYEYARTAKSPWELYSASQKWGKIGTSLLAAVGILTGNAMVAATALGGANMLDKLSGRNIKDKAAADVAEGATKGAANAYANQAATEAQYDGTLRNMAKNVSNADLLRKNNNLQVELNKAMLKMQARVNLDSNKELQRFMTDLNKEMIQFQAYMAPQAWEKLQQSMLEFYNNADYDQIQTMARYLKELNGGTITGYDVLGSLGKLGFTAGTAAIGGMFAGPMGALAGASAGAGVGAGKSGGTGGFMMPMPINIYNTGVPSAAGSAPAAGSIPFGWTNDVSIGR